jgi:hypothetical protein
MLGMTYQMEECTGRLMLSSRSTEMASERGEKCERGVSCCNLNEDISNVGTYLLQALGFKFSCTKDLSLGCSQGYVAIQD